MKYKLVVTNSAEQDIERAMDYYENKQKDLGKKYIFSIKSCLRLVIKNPFAFAKIFMEIRKANTKKFPYSLFYSINEVDKIIILFAVIHNSRNDVSWKNRLK